MTQVKPNRRVRKTLNKTYRLHQTDIWGALGKAHRDKPITQFIADVNKSQLISELRKYPQKIAKKIKQEVLWGNRKATRQFFLYQLTQIPKKIKRLKKTLRGSIVNMRKKLLLFYFASRIRIKTFIKLSKLHLERAYSSPHNKIGKNKFVSYLRYKAFTVFLEARLDVLFLRVGLLPTMFGIRQALYHRKGDVKGQTPLNHPGFLVKAFREFSGQENYLKVFRKKQEEKKPKSKPKLKKSLDAPKYIYKHYALKNFFKLYEPLVRLIKYPFSNGDGPVFRFTGSKHQDIYEDTNDNTMKVSFLLVFFFLLFSADSKEETRNSDIVKPIKTYGPDIIKPIKPHDLYEHARVPEAILNKIPEIRVKPIQSWDFTFGLGKKTSHLLDNVIENITKNGEIRRLNGNSQAKDLTIATLNRNSQAKDLTIATLKENSWSKDLTIATLNRNSQAKDATIATLNENSQAKDLSIATLDHLNLALNTDLDTKDGEITTLNENSQAKDATITTLSVNSQAKDLTIATLNESSQAKDATIATLKNDKIELNATLEAKNHEIGTLEKNLTQHITEQGQKEEIILVLQEKNDKIITLENKLGEEKDKNNILEKDKTQLINAFEKKDKEDTKIIGELTNKLGEERDKIITLETRVENQQESMDFVSYTLDNGLRTAQIPLQMSLTKRAFAEAFTNEKNQNDHSRKVIKIIDTALDKISKRHSDAYKNNPANYSSEDYLSDLTNCVDEFKNSERDSTFMLVYLAKYLLNQEKKSKIHSQLHFSINKDCENILMDHFPGRFDEKTQGFFLNLLDDCLPKLIYTEKSCMMSHINNYTLISHLADDSDLLLSTNPTCSMFLLNVGFRTMSWLFQYRFFFKWYPTSVKYYKKVKTVLFGPDKHVI